MSAVNVALLAAERHLDPQVAARKLLARWRRVTKQRVVRSILLEGLPEASATARGLKSLRSPDFTVLTRLLGGETAAQGGLLSYLLFDPESSRSSSRWGRPTRGGSWKRPTRAGPDGPAP